MINAAVVDSRRRGAYRAPIPTSLTIRTQPSTTQQSGVVLTTQPVLELRDANGAIITSVSVPVTVTIASGSGTLAGTVVLATVNGLATFTNLAITGGGNFTLQFTAPGLASATSSSFAVQLATQLAITTQPAGAVDAVAFTTQPVVEIQTAGGARVTSSTASVTATIATGSGSLVGTVTIAAVAGVATFTNLGIDASSPPSAFTITFSSSGLTSATSGSLTVSASGNPVFPGFAGATDIFVGDTSGDLYSENDLDILRGTICTYEPMTIVPAGKIVVNALASLIKSGTLTVQADGQSVILGGVTFASVQGSNSVNFAQILVPTGTPGQPSLRKLYVAKADIPSQWLTLSDTRGGAPITVGNPGDTASFVYWPRFPSSAQGYKTVAGGTTGSAGGPTGNTPGTDGTVTWANLGSVSGTFPRVVPGNSDASSLNAAGSEILSPGRGGVGKFVRHTFRIPIAFSDLTVDGADPTKGTSPTLIDYCWRIGPDFLGVTLLLDSGPQVDLQSFDKTGVMKFSGALGSVGTPNLSGKAAGNQQAGDFTAIWPVGSSSTLNTILAQTWIRFNCGTPGYMTTALFEWGLKNARLNVTNSSGTPQLSINTGNFGGSSYTTNHSNFIGYVQGLTDGVSPTATTLTVDGTDPQLVRSTFPLSAGFKCVVPSGQGIPAATYYMTWGGPPQGDGRGPFHLRLVDLFGVVQTFTTNATASATLSSVGTAVYPDALDMSVQPIGPFPYQIVDNNWHDFSLLYRPNTTLYAFDGAVEFYVDGTPVSCTRRDLIGVTPAGGEKQWCNASQVVRIPTLSRADSLAMIGVLTAPGGNVAAKRLQHDFTADVQVDGWRVAKL